LYIVQSASPEHEALFRLVPAVAMSFPPCSLGLVCQPSNVPRTGRKRFATGAARVAQGVLDARAEFRRMSVNRGIMNKDRSQSPPLPRGSLMITPWHRPLDDRGTDHPDPRRRPVQT